MAEWEDFYETLGVGPEASPDAMRHAYREKVRAFHPDRLAGVADELRDLAEEQLKAVIRAYEVLRVAEHKRRYDVEWRWRNTPPKPAVEPTHIRFSDVAAGETRTGSFVIRNAGGSYEKISVSNPDSWLKVTGYSSVTDADELPLRVEIEATGHDSDKQYKETIVVRLDRVHTTITVDLRTRPPWGVSDRRSVSSSQMTSTGRPGSAAGIATPRSTHPAHPTKHVTRGQPQRRPWEVSTLLAIATVVAIWVALFVLQVITIITNSFYGQLHLLPFVIYLVLLVGWTAGIAWRVRTIVVKRMSSPKTTAPGLVRGLVRVPKASTLVLIGGLMWWLQQVVLSLMSYRSSSFGQLMSHIRQAGYPMGWRYGLDAEAFFHSGVFLLACILVVAGLAIQFRTWRVTRTQTSAAGYSESKKRWELIRLHVAVALALLCVAEGAGAAWLFVAYGPSAPVPVALCVLFFLFLSTPPILLILAARAWDPDKREPSPGFIRPRGFGFFAFFPLAIPISLLWIPAYLDGIKAIRSRYPGV